MPEIEYIVKHSSAKMPSSCKGIYRRIGLMKVVKGTNPSMISERSKGVLELVETWEKLNVGKTEKCAFQRALKEANETADKLNKQICS